MLYPLANLGLLSLIVTAACGMGFLLLRLLEPPDMSSELLPRTLWALMLGLGCLSYATLLIGLAGALYPWVVWMLLGAGILVLMSTWKSSLPRSTDGAGHRLSAWAKTRPRSWVESAGLGFLMLFVLFNLVVALAPPLSVDDLTYHLAVPKRYATSHAIRYMPDIYYSSLPLTREMLSTLSLVLGSLEGAQLINWFNSLVVLGWIVVLARKADLERRETLVACLLFYTITVVSDQARSGNVEIGGTAFLLGSVAAVLAWCDTFASRWLVLAGVLAGFYAGSKLPNPLFVALVAIWVLVVAWRSIGWRRALVQSTIFTGVAAGVVGVWYLRAWWVTGNPVYPYMLDLFGGPSVSPYFRSTGNVGALEEVAGDFVSIIRARRLQFVAGDPGEILGLLLSYPYWLRVLALPFYVTMRGVEFRGWVGPIYLALLPAVVLSIRRYPTSLRHILVLCGFFLFFWSSTFTMLRTALPLFGLLSVPVAVEVVRLARRHPWMGRMVAAMVTLWFVTSLSRAWIDVLPAAQVVVGLQSRDDYVIDRGPVRGRFTSYNPYRYMNQSLRNDAKVLLWDSRGLYLDRPYLEVLQFMHGLSTPERLADSESALVELKRFGISHVAMTTESKRLWFRRVLEESGHLDCLYQTPEMVVCAVRYPDEADSQSQGPLRSKQLETAGSVDSE